jgi:hypothetical protein
MRPYEVMVIFDAGLEEDAVRALVDRFTRQLTAAGAVPGPPPQRGLLRGDPGQRRASRLIGARPLPHTH